ncbi:MAG: lipocalin-like domain-containing protein [Prevotella sp.]|nr:lipocalin-like domain-containing protein [Prevotella sp.]
MKKTALISIIILLLTAAACTIEHSENGNLDGMWQLTQLDTLDTGSTAAEHSADMRTKGIFWSVQHNLLRMSAVYGGAEPVFFRFCHSAGRLTLSNPYTDNREEGDIKIEDPSELAFYNIDALEPTFSVEQLTSGKMTLSSERFRFHFKKY